MERNRSMIILAFAAAFAAVLLFQAPSAYAQTIKTDKKDTLKYELVSARVKVRDPIKGGIEVEFGKTFPQEYSAVPLDVNLSSPTPGHPDTPPLSQPIDAGQDWLIRSISNDPGSAEISFHPTAVRVEGTADKDNLIVLEIPVGREAALDLTTHRVFLFYLKGNFPFVSMGIGKPTERKHMYVAAKNKDDADIYFSGKAIGAKGSKPTYSFESKLGYFKNVGRRGAVGVQGTMDADQATDADPDSIKAAGAYEWIRVYAPASAFRLHFDAGGEFDRKNKNRNFISTGEVKWILPPVQLGRETSTTFGALDFTAGVELGNNFRNALRPQGIGAFWRGKFGANAYFVARRASVFDAIHISSEWRVRLPHEAEIFVEKVKGLKDPVLSLTTKPRHYVGVDTDFMFNKAFGFTIQYRWGSLPPAFNMVDHKVTAGIKLQLAQIIR